MPIGLIEQRLQEDLASNLRSVALEALRRVAERQGQAPLQEPANRQHDAVGASAPLP
jgi:hypothetical protein